MHGDRAHHCAARISVLNRSSRAVTAGPAAPMFANGFQMLRLWTWLIALFVARTGVAHGDEPQIVKDAKQAAHGWRRRFQVLATRPISRWRALKKSIALAMIRQRTGVQGRAVCWRRILDPGFRTWRLCGTGHLQAWPGPVAWRRPRPRCRDQRRSQARIGRHYLADAASDQTHHEWPRRRYLRLRLAILKVERHAPDSQTVG